MQFAKQCLSAAVEFAPIDNAETPWFATQENVFGNAQLLHQREFLVNDCDSGILRIPNTGEPAFCTVENDFTTVLRMRVNAREDLNECRFAGAVFTDERVDLPFV